MKPLGLCGHAHAVSTVHRISGDTCCSNVGLQVSLFWRFCCWLLRQVSIGTRDAFAVSLAAVVHVRLGRNSMCGKLLVLHGMALGQSLPGGTAGECTWGICRAVALL